MTGALKLAGLAVAALAAWVGLPEPAEADSFSFSYSSGRRHHHGHHHHGHHYYGHRHYGPPAIAFYYGPRYYYPPPPRVVYYPPPPPVVYVPVPTGPAVAAQPASPVFQSPQGRYCREYQATLNVGGRPQPSHGTACLQPDGTWRLMN